MILATEQKFRKWVLKGEGFMSRSLKVVVFRVGSEDLFVYAEDLLDLIAGHRGNVRIYGNEHSKVRK